MRSSSNGSRSRSASATGAAAGCATSIATSASSWAAAISNSAASPRQRSSSSKVAPTASQLRHCSPSGIRTPQGPRTSCPHVYGPIHTIVLTDPDRSWPPVPAEWALHRHRRPRAFLQNRARRTQAVSATNPTDPDADEYGGLVGLLAELSEDAPQPDADHLDALHTHPWSPRRSSDCSVHPRCGKPHATWASTTAPCSPASTRSPQRSSSTRSTASTAPDSHGLPRVAPTSPPPSSSCQPPRASTPWPHRRTTNLADH